jgi:glutamine synthetase
MTDSEILKTLEKEKIRFLRLQFTDILGMSKNVEIPQKQFDKAINGEILFDGSSIEGFVRIEESDMLLKPDIETFRVLPWEENNGRVGRIICDVYHPDGTPFEGCPRMNLRRIIAQAQNLGFTMMAGPEVEFFLFLRNDQGNPTTMTHDQAGYFDLGPTDKGEECRQVIVNALEKMGFEVEAAHHEVAPGQHEIDFKYTDALSTADNIATFKIVVKRIASQFGLHATFMPKPVAGINGSGMHTHISLFQEDRNVFYDPEGSFQISPIGLYYIGGLLKHAKGMCAITNPSINSYKRLLPGFEAPTNITWSERNRSPLARVPARRGMGTRVELRMPDSSCNPYLALAVMLKSGLDGIDNQIDPGPPVNKNIYEMTAQEKQRLHIQNLPATLDAALVELKKDAVVQSALTPHILNHFMAAKEAALGAFNSVVHQWELDRYLSEY